MSQKVEIMTHATYPTDVSALIFVELLNDFHSKDRKIYGGIKEQYENVHFITNAGARALSFEMPRSKGKDKS